MTLRRKILVGITCAVFYVLMGYLHYGILYNHNFMPEQALEPLIVFWPVFDFIALFYYGCSLAIYITKGWI